MSAGPNMATITAALERSLQNCSLSNTHHSHTQPDSRPGIGIDIGIGMGSSSSSSDEIHHHHHHFPPPNSDTALELNSHLSLPYHWEQCLDLKTGEIYYINWRNGMKAKEDPRSTREYNEDYYSDEEEEEEEDDSCYDSEESSTESSTFNSTRDHKNHGVKEEEDEEREEKGDQAVLVVAGCKSCLMYFMVPKHLEDCPKCKNGQLLHFDRSDNDIIP